MIIYLHEVSDIGGKNVTKMKVCFKWSNGEMLKWCNCEMSKWKNGVMV